MARIGNASTAHVVITMEGKQALDHMKMLRNQAISLRGELEAMEKVGMQDTDQYKTKVEDLKRTERAIRQNKSAYIDLNDAVNNLSKHSLAYLQKALRETKKRMNALDPAALAKAGGDYNKELAKLASHYRTIDNYIGKLTGEWKRQDGAILSVVRRLWAYVSVYSGFNMLVGSVQSMIDKNLELSDSMADIRKASGLSADEVARLSDEIRGLDTRTATSDLHTLAFEGSRLGIQGVEGIMQFVKAGNQIKVALGEDLGEGALVELMKMNEVMGTTKELGIEKALLATGSAINTLSASSTASGSQIADFSSRLSGIATQANITTDELLGLASASSSLNLETEVAATAFNKFISEIVTHTSVVAKAAGVEKEALEELIQSGKTMEAVVVVLEALNGKGGLRGLNPIMKELGSDGARLNQVLAAFSSNTDVLRKHLNISTDAFREATSVTQEYNIKNENAAALLARIKNALIDLTTNSTVTKWFEDFLRMLMALPQWLEKNVFAINGVTASLSTLTTALVANKAKMLLSEKGITTWAAAWNVVKVALSSTKTAIVGLFQIIGKHPIMLAVTALGALAGMLYSTIKKSKELSEQQKILNERFKDFDTELLRERKSLNDVFGALNRAKEGTKARHDLINSINKQYGKYLDNMLSEKSTADEIKKAYDRINESLKSQIALKAQKDTIDKIQSQGIDDQADQLDILRKEFGKFTDNSGLIETVIAQIVEKVDSAQRKGISNITTLYDVQRELLGAIVGGGKSTTEEMAEAIDAYIRSVYGTEVEIQNAMKRYKPFIKDGETEQGGTGKNKKGLPPEPVDEKEEAKRKRLALEAAKDEHKAIMAAIEVFYKQQEQVVNESYLNREITIAQREQKLSEIQDRYRRSRIAADEALLNRPGAIAAWKAELAQMQKENISLTEDSNKALENLWKKNLQDIGDKLRRFGDGEMDGIWKNLETDRLKIQEEAIKLRKEIETILTENDFTGIVTREYMEAMQKLGIFFPALADDMQQSAEDMMAGLHELYPKLFDIDIDTSEGLNTFRQMVLNAKDSSVEMATMGEEQMRLLYFQVLKYGDAMTEAQKKTRDRNQKIADEIWKATGGEKREQSMEREGQLLDDKSGQLSRIGLSSEAIVNDAEIELYKRRVEAAQEYRDLVMQMGGDVLSAEQKLNESIDELSNALVDKTLRHLETLKSFVDPLEDFGTKLGEAFAMDDAIERQEAFRDALKDMVGDIGQATKKMIIEWVKQKIQHAITQKAMIKAQKQSQKEMTGAVEEGQDAEAAIVEAGQGAVTDAVINFGMKAVSAKKQQSAENVGTEAAETGAKVPLAIASGAAETISQLGWWGIPLVAVITALLNGLLSAAMSKVGSLFGGSAAPSATAPTKLVTGMLTYDSGNVQSVLGSDGNVYSARVGGVNGSGIVSVPTLTNVGGQAALVGEQGPEIVIGRATTRAMMQNNPALLAGLVQFDKMYSGRGFRTYAGGNVQSYGSDGSLLTPEEREQQQMDRIMQAVNIAIAPALEAVSVALKDSNRTNAALRERLNQPFNTVINKYGRGGLVDEVASGLEQERKSGRNETVRRLFGSR